MPYSCWTESDVDGVDVQEVGGASVRREVALGDLEAHARRVRVLATGVVHREDEGVELRHLALDRVARDRVVNVAMPHCRGM